MAETARTLASRLRRTVHGPMWHGDALLQLLKGVSARDAHAYPIDGAHSIWELVLHIRAWAEIGLQRADGRDTGGDPSDAEDWPPVPSRASESAWRDAIAAMTSAYEALAEFTEGVDDARLRATVTGREYDLRTLLAGVVEHGTYHGGQIAILKRAHSL